MEILNFECQIRLAPAPPVPLSSKKPRELRDRKYRVGSPVPTTVREAGLPEWGRGCGRRHERQSGAQCRGEV